MIQTLGDSFAIDYAIESFLLRALVVASIVAVATLVVLWFAYRTGPKP